jgi:hypothetical protein
MRSQSVWRCAVVSASFSGSFALVCSTALAVPITFQLDPSQSSIALAGFFGAIPLSEQAPGSATTTYSGPISVDVDNPLAPTTIQLLGSSAVAAINGQWLPEAGGGPAAGNPGMAQDANYGLFLNAGALGNAWGAVRNLVFDVTSGVEPVVLGQFPSTQTLTVTTGQFAVNAPALFGGPSEDDLATDTLTNAALPSSYSVSGSLATLTIPISIVDQADLTVMYTGQLVATATVPEPASAALAGVMLISVVGAAAAGRRRK